VVCQPHVNYEIKRKRELKAKPNIEIYNKT